MKDKYEKRIHDLEAEVKLLKKHIYRLEQATSILIETKIYEVETKLENMISEYH